MIGRFFSWLKHRSPCQAPQDRNGLIQLLREATAQTLIDSDALAMIEGVLQVSVMQVRDIMIPRSQIVLLKDKEPLDNIIQTVIGSGHSRFPVLDQTNDQIKGILLAKDLLRYSKQPIDLTSLLRTAVLVPESKRINTLLQECRANRQHMVIVLDEYGGIAGLITIEDILEQIVGDIEDEYDVDDAVMIKPSEEGYYLINALTTIEEFNRYFHTTLDEQTFDTMGGLVLHAFGHMPKLNEHVTIEQYQFNVLQADDRRLHLLQMEKKEPVHSQ